MLNSNLSIPLSVSGNEDEDRIIFLKPCKLFISDSIDFTTIYFSLVISFISKIKSMFPMSKVLDISSIESVIISLSASSQVILNANPLEEQLSAELIMSKSS